MEKIGRWHGDIPGSDETLSELLGSELTDLEGTNNRARDPLQPNLGLGQWDTQQRAQIPEARELDEDTAEIKEQ